MVKNKYLSKPNKKYELLILWLPAVGDDRTEDNFKIESDYDTNYFKSIIFSYSYFKLF